MYKIIINEKNNDALKIINIIGNNKNNLKTCLFVFK